MKVLVFIVVFLVVFLSSCATFRDACTSEADLINRYGNDTDRCVRDLQREARENRNGWIDRGDRIYFK